MRTFIHAAFLAGLLVPMIGAAGAASAADLDYGYEPRPVPVLPPPPPPPCGVYRPCFRPYVRFGYAAPPPYRFYPPSRYAYDKPAYAPIGREGYGYDYDRERFERAHEHFTRYGYEHPRQDRDEPRGYEPREREHIQRYGESRPYADPLGHDRGRDGYGAWRGEHFERYGEEDRGGGRFDRGPEFRGERGGDDRG